MIESRRAKPFAIFLILKREAESELTCDEVHCDKVGGHTGVALGIALGVFLIFGYRVWPAIFVGAFLVNVTTAGSVATSIGIGTGNTLEDLLGPISSTGSPAAAILLFTPETSSGSRCSPHSRARL